MPTLPGTAAPRAASFRRPAIIRCSNKNRSPSRRNAIRLPTRSKSPTRRPNALASGGTAVRSSEGLGTRTFSAWRRRTPRAGALYRRRHREAPACVPAQRCRVIGRVRPRAVRSFMPRAACVRDTNVVVGSHVGHARAPKQEGSEGRARVTKRARGACRFAGDCSETMHRYSVLGMCIRCVSAHAWRAPCVGGALECACDSVRMLPARSRP